MPLSKESSFTTDYIFSLPEGQRAELIDGVVYDMAPPNRLHQELVSELHYKITDYIKKNNGACKVFPAPFAVFLNADDKTYVEPDIRVICDKQYDVRVTILGHLQRVGAPDWIIEIASPSTKRTDYGVKLFKYRSAGVREYWIVNPLTRTVNVYALEKEELNDQYSFDDDIAVCIYDNLTINITELLKQ